jgi:hypothetical protein
MLRSALGDSAERLLIIGPQKSGKTSIAFHLAIELAYKCKHSLIICSKGKMEASPPLPVVCTKSTRLTSSAGFGTGTGTGEASTTHPDFTSSFDADPSLLSFIGLKYVGSLAELKAVFAGLHAYSVVPSLVIVEDFSLLVDPFYSMPRTDSQFLASCLNALAIVHDGVEYVAGRAGAPLALVFTDNCQAEPYLEMLARGGMGTSARRFDQLRLATVQRQQQQDGGGYTAISSSFREIPSAPTEHSTVVSLEMLRTRSPTTGGGINTGASIGSRQSTMVATVKLVVAPSDPAVPIFGDGKKPAESLCMEVNCPLP